MLGRSQGYIKHHRQNINIFIQNTAFQPVIDPISLPIVIPKEADNEQREKSETHITPPHAFIPLVLWCRTKYLELVLSPIAHCQHRCQVPASIAVIWCRPDRHEGIVEHILIPFLYKLVCTCNKCERVDMVELGNISQNDTRINTSMDVKTVASRTSRVTSPPNSQPAPRGLTAQLSISSGSDHIKSVAAMRRHGIEIGCSCCHSVVNPPMNTRKR